MALLTLALAVAVAYLGLVAIRLGLHQRLPLALGPISLEAIPDRAARRFGERPLFTSDTPCRWEVPALRGRYPDPTLWSAARVQVTAGYLAALLGERLQLRRGGRVAIFKANHLDMHVLTAGVVRAGGIACPINDGFAADKLHPYLLNVGAEVLLCDSATLLRALREGAGLGGVRRVVLAERRELVAADRRAELDRLLNAAAPEARRGWIEEELAAVTQPAPAAPRGRHEPLYLVHSSGTTGFPKAVILNNGAQSHAVRGWLCYVHLSRTRDRGYLAVPNNHQAVILTFNSLLLLGLPTHWTRAFGHRDFDAERVVRELAEGRFTGYFGFPITYTQLKEVELERFDLRAMRFWASTADASHETVQRRFVAVGGAFRSFGIPLRGSVFLDAQGSSEVGTPSVLRYVTRFTRSFGRRIGRPGSTPFGPRIRVLRDDGRPARRGEVGRLEVRGRTLFGGYWNNHALTLEAMRDRWFFTGDLVRRGRDGHLVQLDREVDVVHTRRGPVYTLPIEEVVHSHPAVFDACVYAARQPDGTQLPAALIAIRPASGATPETLLRDLNDLLAEEQRLRHLDIVPWSDFPIGVTGKTLKRVLRDRTESAAPPERNRPVLWPDPPVPPDAPLLDVQIAPP